jgi:hypothetical protein
LVERLEDFDADWDDVAILDHEGFPSYAVAAFTYFFLQVIVAAGTAMRRKVYLFNFLLLFLLIGLFDLTPIQARMHLF